jgi:hypothetical protein
LPHSTHDTKQQESFLALVGASDYSHYAVLKSYCPKATARTSGCSFAALSQKIVMQKECIDVHIWVLK